MIGLSDEIRIFCERHIGSIKEFKPVGGGCINHGGHVFGAGGDAFLKWNDARKYPHMFYAEEAGLEWLHKADACRVPEVIGVFEGEQHSGILLEWIDPGHADEERWAQFGRDLAKMHQLTGNIFGLDHSNYMGSLQQQNNGHVGFSDFFREERLKPQIRMAVDNGFLQSSDFAGFERIFSWLEENMNDELPVLVHGDLWSGNAMIDANGKGVLIDPAVSFSSRHVDLAMTTLFGGFNGSFYAGYGEVYPFPIDHQRIWDVMNLYPLLVHVNLFGASYLSQTRQILRSI